MWHECPELGTCAAATSGMPANCGTAHTQFICLHVTPQYGNTAAAEGPLWAGDAVAALMRGALGSLRLAHAEAEAQRAWHANRTPGTATPDPCKPLDTRRLGASILEGVAQGMTPSVACTLAERGLVGPLLQVGPHEPMQILHNV